MSGLEAGAGKSVSPRSLPGPSKRSGDRGRSAGTWLTSTSASGGSREATEREDGDWTGPRTSEESRVAGEWIGEDVEGPIKYYM